MLPPFLGEGLVITTRKAQPKTGHGTWLTPAVRGKAVPLAFPAKVHPARSSAKDAARGRFLGQSGAGSFLKGGEPLKCAQVSTWVPVCSLGTWVPFAPSKPVHRKSGKSAQDRLSFPWIEPG